VYFLSRTAGSDVCFLIGHLSPPMQAASCDAIVAPLTSIFSNIDIDPGSLRLVMQRSRCRVLLL
jgi:hypothetical protein